MTKKTVVTVAVTKKYGWYIVTSPGIKELIVCHKDFDTLMAEIPECIKILYKLNYNMEVDISEIPKMPESSSC